MRLLPMWISSGWIIRLLRPHHQPYGAPPESSVGSSPEWESPGFLELTHDEIQVFETILLASHPRRNDRRRTCSTADRPSANHPSSALAGANQIKEGIPTWTTPRQIRPPWRRHPRPRHPR